MHKNQELHPHGWLPMPRRQSSIQSFKRADRSVSCCSLSIMQVDVNEVTVSLTIRMSWPMRLIISAVKEMPTASGGAVVLCFTK